MHRPAQPFLACGGGYGESSVVLFGAPYDGTVSGRPGARFAGAAMREESHGLETYSPYLDRDLEDSRVCDLGELELPHGRPEPALARIEETAGRILDDGKLPLMLGGEHLVTLGAVRAAAARHPGLCIVHFDAHADLRDDFLGEKLSHATVMRRCWELVGDGRIHQRGIRSGDREELRWAKDRVDTGLFTLGDPAELARQLAGQPVYLSVDLDVLDPSELPGTGTPEAGGVSFDALRRALMALGGLPIVGADIVELSPPCDPGGASTALACKLLRELLLRLTQP